VSNFWPKQRDLAGIASRKQSSGGAKRVTACAAWQYSPRSAAPCPSRAGAFGALQQWLGIILPQLESAMDYRGYAIESGGYHGFVGTICLGLSRWFARW
jgi:hypothetical protein